MQAQPTSKKKKKKKKNTGVGKRIVAHNIQLNIILNEYIILNTILKGILK